MIISNLDQRWPLLSPPEANSPLVIDSYRVLPVSVAFERLQAVARRNTEVCDVKRLIEHLEFSQGWLLDCGELAGFPKLPEVGCLFAVKFHNHFLSVSLYDTVASKKSCDNSLLEWYRNKASGL